MCVQYIAIFFLRNFASQQFLTDIKVVFRIDYLVN